MGVSGSTGDELRQGASTATKTTKTTAKVAKKTTKGAVKTAKGTAKTIKAAAGSLKAIGAAIAAAGPIGYLIAGIATFVIIVIIVMTNFAPTTSFNAFTHHNDTQTPITQREHKTAAGTATEEEKVSDLTLVEEEEQKALVILTSILTEETEAAMQQIKNLCNNIPGVDYEATLQFAQTQFAAEGTNIFANTAEGTYTQEQYDASVFLSAYSVSVDNLWDESSGNEEYPLKGSDVIGGAGGDTDFTPNEKQLSTASYVRNEMKNAGYNDIAVAAVLGNMQRESGMSVKATNPSSGAYGLCQWLGSRKANLKKFCKNRDLDYKTKEGQTAYLLYELSATGYRNVGRNLRSAIDIQEATIMFCRKFEQCSESEEVINKRINYANGYYNSLVGGEPRILDQKHWTTNLEAELRDYFKNNDYYEVSIVTDENGNPITEDVVIDVTENYEERQENIEDQADADKTTAEAQGGTGNNKKEEIKDRAEENASENAENLNKAEEEAWAEMDPQFEERTYVQIELKKKEATAVACNMFDITDEDIVQIYGEMNSGSGKDILHTMAYNNLALLHNIEDPENSLVESEFTMNDFEIGKELGKYKIITYCTCGSKECNKNLKNLFGTTGIPSIKRTAGITCAVPSDSGIRPSKTSKTVLWLKSLNAPLIAEDTLGEKYDGQKVIAVYVGKNHEKNKDVIKTFEQIKGMQAIHATAGLSPAQAKNLNSSASGINGWPYEKGQKLQVTSNFGWRVLNGGKDWHSGIDMDVVGNNNYPPIFATETGTVVQAGWCGGYGNFVRIKHSNGLETCYAHLSKILVQSGQRVTAGQQIGLQGNTGNSFGSHLHYEVRVNSEKKDPKPYLGISHVKKYVTITDADRRSGGF